MNINKSDLDGMTDEEVRTFLMQRRRYEAAMKCSSTSKSDPMTSFDMKNALGDITFKPQGIDKKKESVDPFIFASPSTSKQTESPRCHSPAPKHGQPYSPRKTLVPSRRVTQEPDTPPRRTRELLPIQESTPLEDLPLPSTRESLTFSNSVLDISPIQGTNPYLGTIPKSPIEQKPYKGKLPVPVQKTLPFSETLPSFFSPAATDLIFPVSPFSMKLSPRTSPSKHSQRSRPVTRFRPPTPPPLPPLQFCPPKGNAPRQFLKNIKSFGVQERSEFLKGFPVNPVASWASPNVCDISPTIPNNMFNNPCNGE